MRDRLQTKELDRANGDEVLAVRCRDSMKRIMNE